MIIKIDHQTVSKEILSKWQLRRIQKVLATLGQSMAMSQDAEAMQKQLAEKKLKYTYDEMLRLLRFKLRMCNLMMNIGVTLSGNKRKFAVTEISMDGISAEEVTHGLDILMLEQSAENNKVNLWACPDHYVLRPGADSSLEVIETCGSAPFPMQFFIKYGDETGLQTPRDLSYPYQSAGVAYSKSGKLIGGVRHQFRDTDTGFEARLVVEFPAILPTPILKAHQMHLACEFSHWFLWLTKNYK